MDGGFLTRRKWLLPGVVLLVVGGVLMVSRVTGSPDQVGPNATEPDDRSASGYIPQEVATLGESDCPVFPADNVWHSLVDGTQVPLVDPDDPRAVMLDAASGPVRTTFGAGLNIVPTAGSSVQQFRVASNWLAPSNIGHARSTDADRAGLDLGTFPWFAFDLLAPPREELRWRQMSLDPSTDNHLYLIDTDECISSEFVGFNGLLAVAGSRLEANRLSQFDLRSNNRRLSRTWGEGPCPSVPPNALFNPGCDGSEIKPGAARGGSGLSGVGGLIRADELANQVGIDHAVAVVLPKNLVSAGAPVWPATVTDGLGVVGTFPDAPPGAAPIPMGSRLRLRADFVLDCGPESCPQATAVVDGLRRHGAIVVDAMGPVENLSDAGMHLGGEMSPEWDEADLRRIELRSDGSPALRLSDFELVDAEDMRALPNASPQDDGWLEVR